MFAKAFKVEGLPIDQKLSVFDLDRPHAKGLLVGIEQLVQGEEEEERIRYIVNQLAQQTMRENVSARWFPPLDSISYIGLDAALEDEVEKLYVSATASLSHRQSFSNYPTVDLSTLKEMTQELAALFGIALPISGKGQAAP